MVRATNDTRVVAMPTTFGPIHLSQDFAPTIEARRLFQTSSDAYLDGCLTDTSCMPRSFDNGFEATDGRFYGGLRLKRATWRVVRYPAVDLPGVLSAAPDGKIAFAGQVTCRACCASTR